MEHEDLVDTSDEVLASDTQQQESAASLTKRISHKLKILSSTRVTETVIDTQNMLPPHCRHGIYVVPRGIALCVCVFITAVTRHFWPILAYVRFDLAHLLHIINGKVIIFIR